MIFNTVVEWTAVTFMCLVTETLAPKFCSYKTPYGIQYVECPETCCPAPSGEANLCCGNNYSYVGGGLVGLVLVALIILCLVNICCKKRISRTARQLHTERLQHTSAHPHSDEAIPSISLNIEPTLPPPYSLLPSPPPYYPIDSQTGSSGKSNKSSFQDYLPPDYTETSPDHPLSDSTETSPEGKLTYAISQ